MKDMNPGNYDSDDLDRLVVERDRNLVKCPVCGEPTTPERVDSLHNRSDRKASKMDERFMEDPDFDGFPESDMDEEYRDDCDRCGAVDADLYALWRTAYHGKGRMADVLTATTWLCVDCATAEGRRAR